MPKAKARKRGHREKLTIGPMLTIGEACQILYVHSNTLRRWSEQGVIRAYRVGPRGDRRFKLDDVAALLIEIAREDPSRFIN